MATTTLNTNHGPLTGADVETIVSDHFGSRARFHGMADPNSPHAGQITRRTGGACQILATVFTIDTNQEA